jgi:hypothetical protein
VLAFLAVAGVYPSDVLVIALAACVPTPTWAIWVAMREPDIRARAFADDEAVLVIGSDPEQSAMNGSPASLGPKVRRCAAAGVENSDPVAYSTGDEEFVGSDLRLELVSRPAVGSRHCAGPPRRSPPA